ncbi:LLM class flavin-dependent oxidoreductase [Candidatus Poriferisodalis sp.]|uniref:LLM class flavin-dependent oxidoreductase n=1 Tax=Candidatus Poriferisodalis sp. TaxID=3101277 RepID=UPI003B01E063
MDVGIIIGEATPLSWERWRHICRLVERLEFDSLYRSDHYFNGKQKDAIDVYLSFVMAAAETERLRFGPLVTPITFREPVNVGRMAQQLESLAPGRFVLGLGAGWYPDEHAVYGIDFPAGTERYDRLEEALALMKELWYSASGRFDGSYYRISGTDSKPHPPPGRPPILIGGSGPRRTLRIVAQHAHEWNTTPLDVAAYRAANEALAGHCEDVGRDPAAIRKSMLIFAAIGPDDHHERLVLQRFLDMMAPEGSGISLDDAIAAGHGPWQGSVEQLVDHCGQLRDLGLDEVVFEHFCHEDDTVPEWMAAEIMPRLAAL